MAGLGSNHITELGKNKITTLKGLSKLKLPVPFKPSRGAVETYTRLREQARVQEQSRTSGKLVFELIDLVEGRGFYNLPAPSKGDIFFDIEGDPYVGNGGLEFLFGWSGLTDKEKYYSIWAHNPAQEKEAFETFVYTVMERWKKYPDMHIYHFTAYEPGAVKRLMGRYATCEFEVDKMLRAGLFVDLHGITRQAVRAGVETYSLKELEKLHNYKRKLDLADARYYLRIAQRDLERQEETPLSFEIRKGIEQYNEDDCRSTQSLRDWLEAQREKLLKKVKKISRPVVENGNPSASLTKRQQKVSFLIQQLTADIPEDPALQKPGEKARLLLASMLDWYRREEKALWWEFFRMRDLQPIDMLEEKYGIGFLNVTGKREETAWSIIDEYSYPAQDAELREGDKIHCTQTGNKFGEVFSHDRVRRKIKIKKTASADTLHPESVFVFDKVPNAVKEESVERMAWWILENGMAGKGKNNYRAGRDLLLKLKPREEGGGILPIQGPPGAGKSHRAAQMILDEIKAGKKVGITALSHKVIVGLMHKVIQLAKEQHVKVMGMRKVSNSSATNDKLLIEESSNDRVLEALRSRSIHMLGGTAWLWSREEMENSVDTLFVDEAGQLSLIDTLAVSPAATKLVMLGDPQQLQQPQKGVHPEGTDVSALQHLLEGRNTILPEKGIFLDTTWRMHPEICKFVSELFYDGKLQSRPELVNQSLSGKTEFEGAGLFYCPVSHEGNQGHSQEEADVVKLLVKDLLSKKINYTDKQNQTRLLKEEDIKIITPYNAQAALLSELLPDIQIGTVDKFQGQEAPVVIFSMATSTPADAPRGMEFLYNANRLNVAVSRARSTFILVASPALFEPDCRTVEQMRLANSFSRFLEMANTLSIRKKIR